MIDVTKAKPAPRKRRGSYAKSVATRESILDAALEVFSESGYRSGSLRDIAERVGMSEAGLLHHFRNKGALLLAVLDRRDEKSRQVMDFEAADAIDRLVGLVRLAAYNASIPGVVELYCTLSAEGTSPDHPAHEYFVRRYEATRLAVADTFIRLAEQGCLRPDIDIARAGIATIAFMDGLQVQWLLDRDALDMARMLADFLAGMLVEGAWPRAEAEAAIVRGAFAGDERRL